MSIESQLREALSVRADEVGRIGGSSGDPYARVAGAIAVSRRRRRTATLAGIAAVAAIAVAVPALAGGLGRETTSPAKRTQVVVPGPKDPRWASMSTWPTRGSLAEDRAFLDQVRARTLAPRVLYAGDLATARVVILWTPDETDGNPNGQVSLQQGPPGASADQLAETAMGTPHTPDAVSALVGTAEASTAVLLAAPASHSASLATSVTIDRDGTVSRSWQDVSLVDGAALVETSSAPYASRVKLGGSDGTPDLVSVQSVSTPDATICLSCTGDDFRVKAEAATSDSVAAILGLRPSDVRTTTVYYGRVDPQVAALSRGLPTPTTGGATTDTLFVADSRLPEGQVLRSAILLTLTGGGTGESAELATAVPIDADTAEQRPFVLVGQTDDQRTVLQVFAPHAAAVTLTSDAPTLYPDATSTVQESTARFTLDEVGVSEHRLVVTRDGAGREVGRWPLALPANPYDVGETTTTDPIAPFTS
jgi:hypothetical protein